jgi:hypothetical protein
MLTVDEDGRVFGLIAEWDTPHTGNPDLRPPKNFSGYRYFNRKPVRTAEGVDVRCGQLTLTGGHADLSLDPDRTVRHYDDTRSAVADVTVGENKFGIWAAGAIRPDVTPEQLRAFRAAEPSGDWRKRDGQMELLACCMVNTAGLPGHATCALRVGRGPVAGRCWHPASSHRVWRGWLQDRGAVQQVADPDGRPFGSQASAGPDGVDRQPAELT